MQFNVPRVPGGYSTRYSGDFAWPLATAGNGAPAGVRRYISAPVSAADVELRLLANRRSEIVAGQTRRASRLRDLSASIHPQLEQTVDVTDKTGWWLLIRYVTPGEIRTAGRRRLVAHLRAVGAAH